jgi:TRAP-type uncharacterized transport system fused permease subunit
MRSMMAAMRFGAVKYALPFFFVYNPALVLQDSSLLHIVELLAAAVIGLGLVAYALQGYLPGVGVLNRSVAGHATRGILIVAGLLLALPERITTVVGLVVAAATYAAALAASRMGRAGLVTAADRLTEPDAISAEASGER